MVNDMSATCDTHARWHPGRRGSGKEEERAQEAGEVPDVVRLLPWLLLGMGAFSNLFQGTTPNPWIGAAGLLAFNSLYIFVACGAHPCGRYETRSRQVALGLLAAVTCALAIGYGGGWLLFFPLLGLATGVVLRGRRLAVAAAAVTVVAGAVSFAHDGWGGLTILYVTAISTMVTATLLRLAETVRELRAAREELARRAVEKERLRFSRDLHDLLGHTMSLIVVKSEAARRLAPRDLDAALAQVTDIESVGRQALTEIREAVTGYREGGLDTELDRARSALTAAGVTAVVRRSGPPLGPRTEVLLGWVVREAVTNVIRHSAARHCEITVAAAPERVVLTIADDGEGTPGTDTGGTGLHGLTERLAAAGGSLRTGADGGAWGRGDDAGGARRGFTLRAELPTDATDAVETRDAGDAGERPDVAGGGGTRAEPVGAGAGTAERGSAGLAQTGV
ncbi:MULTISPECIES: sensor histidine kinase [unclassified Streptomyces]|nr:sensor histidine kinase [Streptomyces sp. WAC 01438]RSM94431.1 sensor histidine kinase [Streptomyces sp. WAC 01420]